MKLTNDDHRSLAVIAVLLLSAGTARWLDRPKPILEDQPQLDLVALQADSRAQQRPRTASGKAPKPKSLPAVIDGKVEKIDLNRATVAQLQQLPGVGPALADRIRAAADSAPFRTQADLGRVPGIGPAMIRKLAPLITLKEANPGPAPAKATRAPTPVPPPGPVDLNRATAAELQTIKGVGEVLAGKIVARRDSLRQFTDWAQVDGVSGVGVALLARLKAGAVLRD